MQKAVGGHVQQLKQINSRNAFGSKEKADSPYEKGHGGDPQQCGIAEPGVDFVKGENHRGGYQGR